MITLDAIRECLEGVVPGNIATCAPDGTPNVAYLSQVQYVDVNHVALSYQFFNTTRRNILASPYARVSVIDPHTAAHYRMTVQYLRTEESGALFENMKARLAGVASHTGMSGVFRLLGADVYRVLDIEQVPGETLPPPPPRRNLLAALRACAGQLCGAADLDGLLAALLDGLQRQFGIEHAMVLMLDGAGERLYTVASRGYENSGIGAEIALGDGVIGVAARERTPIRIGHFTADYTYGRAIRSSLEGSGAGPLETEIPLPGLPDSCSQLAVPILACGALIGVLYVESAEDLRFGYDDEDALVALAGQVGVGIRLLQQGQESAEESPPAESARAGADGEPLRLRHYAENDSVFVDGDYLIKGVAGAILWTLLRDYVEQGRSQFSNRELRLDPRIRLPDLSDNLEARLILLARRLEERAAPLRIEKTGRGRFRLCVSRPLVLESTGARGGLPPA
ncbi:GAF domain-containing protein [Azoarcus olearius]|uniref:Phosphoenolpyruvate-protein phosphotransferase n=1 Tax=Azoarcus sp. (strain BH72) TaxID=418699 RepID=A1K5Q0_AZOSB|nr:GAF domain-containing protein [Azoarcus olearius]CAL94155.1 putative phosphoenolpyruvate-protein phosphotransferase [Azoarcus olearius]